MPEVPPAPPPDYPPAKTYIVKTVDLRVDGKASLRTHTRTTDRAHAINTFINLVALGENAWLLATDDPAPVEG